MKTTFTLAILAASVAGLTACGPKDNTTASTDTTAPSAMTATSTAPLPGPATAMAATSDTPSAMASSAPVAPADTSAPAGSVSDGDRAFMLAAAQSGYAEIAASKLAREKSKNGELKKFADEMIKDHTTAGDELKKIADAKSVTLPADDAGKYTSQLNALQSLSGRPFDQSFADNVGVAAHHDAVDLFKTESESGQDADLKAFAAKTLPKLEHHLSMADKLDKDVNKGK